MRGSFSRVRTCTGRHMSARAIVSGSLQNPPARRTSANGNDYILATIREGTGDATPYWSAFVFGETPLAEFEGLQVGEPVAVADEIEAKVYSKDGGEPRVFAVGQSRRDHHR